MRNIFLFIRRFSHFFTFLFLQIICLFFIFRFNRFHNAAGMTFASKVTGRIHEKYSEVQSFFSLRRTNDSLLKRNAELINLQKTNYLQIDTSKKEVADFIPIDTLGNVKKILRFVYRPATVIYKTENDDKKNYIVLARGKDDGLAVDMAVMGAQTHAVLGKVVYADARYAVVMSLLHKQSVVPAKLFRTGETGPVSWDGRTARYLTLSRIPKTAEIKKGDSVITSSNSTIFPPGLLIGTIESFTEEKSSGNYNIRIKPRADFYNVQYVYVIENMQQKEINAALKAADKQIDKQPRK
jgi:rod shape-determining protein MreC